MCLAKLVSNVDLAYLISEVALFLSILAIQNVIHMTFGGLISIPCFMFTLDCSECRPIQPFWFGFRTSSFNWNILDNQVY